MSSSIIIHPHQRTIRVRVYEHDSLGPKYHDVWELEATVKVCQTRTLRDVADAVEDEDKEGNWRVGRILDCYGDEFVDPEETVWGALGLGPVCVVKAAPVVEGEGGEAMVEAGEKMVAKLENGGGNASNHEVGMKSRFPDVETTSPTTRQLPIPPSVLSKLSSATVSKYRQAPHHSSSVGRKSTVWNDEDDQILLTARAAGYSFPKIQAGYFPSRTAGSCQKRYQRLLTLGRAAYRGGLKAGAGVATVSEARQVLIENGAGEELHKDDPNPMDESEDEPLLLPAPRTPPSPYDIDHIGAPITTPTNSIINRKALEQQHRRKRRREEEEARQNSLSPIGAVDKVKIEPEDHPMPDVPQVPSRIDMEQTLEFDKSPSLSGGLTIDEPHDRPFPQTAADYPPPSSSIDPKEALRHTHHKPSSLTPIKIRGKSKKAATPGRPENNTPATPNNPSTTSQEQNSEADLPQLSSHDQDLLQQEADYEKQLKRNLRLARKEAERQTSSTQLERMEKALRHAYPAWGPLSGDEWLQYEAPHEMDGEMEGEMDSSPSARVARNRRRGEDDGDDAEGEGEWDERHDGEEYGAFEFDECIMAEAEGRTSEAEMGSSPPVIRGEGGVRFEEMDDEEMLRLLADGDDDMVDVAESAAGETEGSNHEGSAAPRDMDPAGLLSEKLSDIQTRPAMQKMAREIRHPMSESQEKPAPRIGAPGASQSHKMNGVNHLDTMARPMRRFGDRVSKRNGIAKGAKKATTRKPGF